MLYYRLTLVDSRNHTTGLYIYIFLAMRQQSHFFPLPSANFHNESRHDILHVSPTSITSVSSFICNAHLITCPHAQAQHTIHLKNTEKNSPGSFAAIRVICTHHNTILVCHYFQWIFYLNGCSHALREYLAEVGLFSNLQLIRIVTTYILKFEISTKTTMFLLFFVFVFSKNLG